VNWGIRLFRDDDTAPFDAIIEDISSGGVAFISTRRLQDGEYLNGLVLLPAETRPWGNGAVVLECRLRVLYAEEKALPEYRVRCEIKAYRIRAVQPSVPNGDEPPSNGQ
jgi:hypothetical protein